MDAEEELQAIWGPKTKKPKVRQVTSSAAHPINKLRQQRWSDVQSESSYFKSEPINAYALDRKNSVESIPSRPSNP
jgi:hypothetical protein